MPLLPAWNNALRGVACMRTVLSFHVTPAFCRALYNANELVFVP